jgi:hypothetical protein
MLYPALIILNLCFSILAYILNPIVVLFADDRGNLPKWLSWFQTQDSSLDQTPEFIAENWPWLVGTSRIKKYLQRLTWLYRNTAYGFAYWVCGTIIDYDHVAIHGNPKCSNTDGVSGWRFLYDKTDMILLRPWSLYTAFQYGSSSYCFQIYVGWKISPTIITGERREMLAMRINPFMHFGKK